MPRSLLKTIVRDVAGNSVMNAKVFVYESGTTTPVADLYPSKVGGAPQTFLLSNAQGEIIGWLDEPRDVALKTTDNGGTAVYPVAAAAGAPVNDALAGHIAQAVGAHAATAISFAPTDEITATNVQDAIVEAAGLFGAFDDRPDAGIGNRYYIATWAGTTITRLYYDNGTDWIVPTDAAGIFNPLDYGADPTAATGSRAAYLACQTAATTNMAAGPYGDGNTYGEIQWTAGQYNIEGGDVTLPTGISFKQSAVGGGRGTFAWQRQVVITFDTGGFVLDGSQSSFLTWEGLEVISLDGNALRCDGGAGPGILRDCTLRSVTTGFAAMQLDNVFWGYFDNVGFEAPDTSTPSVLIQSDSTSGAGNKNEGWIFKWENCRFEKAGVLWETSVTVANLLGQSTSMDTCVGENFGAGGVLMHIVGNHATLATHHEGVRMIASYCDDSNADHDLLRFENTGAGSFTIEDVHVENSRGGTSGYDVRFLETGAGACFSNNLQVDNPTRVLLGTAVGVSINGVIAVGDRTTAVVHRTRVKGDTHDRYWLRGDGNILRGPGTANPTVFFGTNAGTPEGSVTSGVGGFCTDITNGEAYIKQTGTGNTGWDLVTHA